MKVLVVHNLYSSRVPSGENLSVADEVTWLRHAGVEVELHEATNDDVVGRGRVDQVRHAVQAPWSVTEGRAVAAVIDRFEPDIVHVHNPFPLITASVPWAALRRGVPVVWTVRNRKVVCVAGSYFRDGQPCHACRPGWRLPGVRFGCYGGSPLASAVVTTGSSVYRALARRRVTTLAISRHLRDWLVTGAGFDPQRVHVKYNGIAPPAPGSPAGSATASRTFLFVGRLTGYKGVSLLLDAWQRTKGVIDAELRIIGDGTMAPAVREAAADDPRITWLGALPASEVPAQLARARAVVVPSTCEETFGRVAAEAVAHRRGVIVTALGGLAEIVTEQSGWRVEPDARALSGAIAEVAASDRLLADRVEVGYRRYERLFSPEAATSALLQIYEDALRTRSARTGVS